MTEEAPKSLICESCGASALDHTGKCQKCNTQATLKNYGFEITKLKTGSYIVTDTNANKLQSFYSLRVSAQDSVRKITKTPFEAVAATFATLESKESQEKEEAEKKKQQKQTVKEEPAEKVQRFDAETEAKINETLQMVLEAPNQLEALTPHLNNMLFGEDNTKKVVCVLCFSAKCKDECKVIILFKSTEGAGKSTIMRTVTKGYKVKDIGRFSAHALDYTDMEGFEILNLKELGSMDKEEYGVSTLKFVSCEDGGYKVEVVVRDTDTGKFKTEEHTIAPITTISSTTRLQLDPQFERRAWSFGLDETEEQSRRIGEFIAKKKKQDYEKKLGIRKLTDDEFSSEVYRRFVKQFKPVEVVIPFPQAIINTLGFNMLRVRGDINKLLTFVELYAMLNLKRLKKIGPEEYKKIINEMYVVTPEVALEALNLALQPIARMLSKVDDRTRVLFTALKKVTEINYTFPIEGEKVENLRTFDIKGAQISKKIRDKIAVEIGKSEKVVRVFLSSLAAAGYVSEDNKKPKTFTLLYDIKEIEEKTTGLLDKSVPANDLIIQMQKEAFEWLNSLLENFFLADCDKKSFSIVEDKINAEFFSPVEVKKISNADLSFFEGDSAVSTSKNCQIKEIPIRQTDFYEATDFKGYEQKSFRLEIKATSKVEDCKNCTEKGVWLVQQYTNGKLEITSFNCDVCLKEITIPAWKAQDAIINIQAPKLTEEALI
jgi:hypothetical protein